MWSRPRNPQRNPKPSAADVSGSKWNDASFSRSFSSASRSCGYSLPSTGYSPAKTIGFISLKPGNGSSAGRPASVIVSPICASLTVLIPAKMNPTSPTPSSSTGMRLGRERADLLDLVLLPLLHELDLHAGADDAVDDARQDDDAAVRVVPGVEDQRLQRRVGIPLRRRQPVHDRLENLVDAGAFLGAREDRVARVEPDDVLDLPLGFVGLRARADRSC